LAEADKELVEEWNAAYPQWKLSVEGELDERPSGKGHELLRYNRIPARLETAPEGDPFVDAWEQFKSDQGAYDFTDLLLHAPECIGAKVLFVDEAQDLTPLQWQVVRQWGTDAETFVVAGDDDQLLYDFLGASPEAFLTPLPEDRIRILKHSHRLPRMICEYAKRWTSTPTGLRQEKEYTPRDDEGMVERRSLKLGQPQSLCDEIEDRVGDGQSVMVLASCNYMLRPLLNGLRQRAVPFHNPYRLKRADWNPLRTTGQRVLAFLRCARASQEDRLLPVADWWAWCEMLRASGRLQHGAKTEMRRGAGSDEHTTWDDLERWVTAPLLQAVLDEDVDRMAQNVTQRFAKAIR
jgi:hypothetical protein